MERYNRSLQQMHTTATTPAFRKTADTFTSGAKTLPQRYFVSPEIFAKEEEKIFSAQWVLVGHQSQIAKAGDYFIQEVAGESLIVLRDQKREVRGFYNVCRHRGTRLCEERNGHSSTIQCPYHAWTYGLDGRLVGVPHMDKVQGFDKAEYSLHAVNLALWEGFIFVNLADAPAPLEEAPSIEIHWDTCRSELLPLQDLSSRARTCLGQSHGSRTPPQLVPACFWKVGLKMQLLKKTPGSCISFSCREYSSGLI